MLSDNDHVPLMNKVLQGLYPPGSTVKPMNALALLRAGVAPRPPCIAAARCRSAIGAFHCHKRGGHGAVNMKQRRRAELRHLFLLDGARARL